MLPNKNLLKIGYPLSNVGYVLDVNQWVIDHNPGASTTEVESITKEILETATLFNSKNKTIRTLRPRMD